MVSVALLEKQNRGLLLSEEAVDHKFNVHTLNIAIAPLFPVTFFHKVELLC